MAVNRYQPHVLVLPEDDADRQLANGFVLDPSLATRKIQVLEEAGGWVEVLNCFESDHVPAMENYPNRFMVLLIDFDGQEDRLTLVKSRIPTILNDRVFVLGCRTEPEDLRRALGVSYEAIGQSMSRDCREDGDGIWGNVHLKHNLGELNRLRRHVRPILFP